MPWRGPSYEGEFPTLGWLVGEWIEANCVIPDGEAQGQPYRLTDEMWRFLAHHYRLKLDARPGQRSPAFHNRRSQLVRPQKWGKSPFTAAMICVEAVGPVLFDGWDAAGEPVGRPWPTPIIQITANSEDQTNNVYGALTPMIQMGPLDKVIRAGEQAVKLPGGGRIDPVTSKARSRLGQRVTFVVMDETGLWTEANGMLEVAKTQRRGLAGMAGRAVETTNAWDPAENSYAQRTYESDATDIYRDYVKAPPHDSDTGAWSYKNKRERRRIHEIVYGDSWWVDLDAIDAEAAELIEYDPGNAERFFGNRVVAGLGAWMPEDVWLRTKADFVPAEGSEVALGFDGSETNDWTAIRLVTKGGFRFTPRYGPDRRPTIWDPKAWGGEIPRGEVDAAVDEIVRRYKVRRAYCDPKHWYTEIGDWALRHGDEVFMEWKTDRITQMHAALVRALTDLVTGRSSHDDCPITKAHVVNARKLAKPGDKYILGKPNDHQKIDAAMADVLAYEAWADVTEANEWRQESYATAQWL
jgi:hypothetical protein